MALNIFVFYQLIDKQALALNAEYIYLSFLPPPRLDTLMVYRWWTKMTYKPVILSMNKESKV